MADDGYGGVGTQSETVNDFLSGPLDPFREVEIEKSAVRCRPMTFPPNSLTGSSLVFDIGKMDPHHGKMRSAYLSLLARVVRGDRKPWKASEKNVAPIHLYGSALFSSVDIDLYNRR